MQDYKLGLRMLAKYPGLTIAGGLALAIAIGIGAAWFDVTRQMWRPTIPLPEGDRIVEIEMRDPRKNGDEHRIMHDFVGWRRAARVGHGRGRLSHRAAQPGHRRRPAGAGDRRRDHGVGAGARPRASPAGTTAARSRRAARRGTRGGPWLHGVAAAVRRTPRHRRTAHPDRAGHDHRRRRHARGLRLPRQPSPLDAADGVSGRVRAADRAADHAWSRGWRRASPRPRPTPRSPP